MVSYGIIVTIALILLQLAQMSKRDEGERAKRTHKILFFLTWLIFVLFFGLRGWSVGIDSFEYARELQGVADGTFSLFERQSPGYYLIELLVVSLFGTNYTMLFLTSSGICFFFLLAAIRDNSSNYVISLFILISFGYIFEVMNQVRELIAIAIILYSFKYLKHYEMKRFLIFLIIAASFHITSLVFALVLLVYRLCISDSVVVVVVAILLICILLNFIYPYIESIVANIPVFGVYIGTIYDQKPSLNTYLIFFYRICLVAFIIITSKSARNKFEETNLLVIILLIGIVFQSLCLSSTVYGRLPSYFIAFLTFAIPNAFCAMRKSTLSVLVKYITIFTFCFLLVANVTQKDYLIEEYKPFWEETLQIL